ncbi:hypothetical protein BsWGS_02709 [Bradybaena similaris]
MATHVGASVLPGDVLKDIKLPEGGKKLLLGPGLIEDGDTIKVCKPGILRYREPGVYWLDCHQKRYVACKGDQVLGVVTQKNVDMFRVDIGCSELASLSYLSFEGATKRNRPDVKVGDVVYAKILVANKYMEPELVCIDSHGRSSGMGVIRGGGFFVHTSLNLARKFLNPQCILMKALGSRLKFEIAVGMNGTIWLKTQNDVQTIALVNAIFAAEFMNNDQIVAMCKKLSKVMSGMD